MSGFFVVSKRNGSVAKQKAQVPAGKWTWGQRQATRSFEIPLKVSSHNEPPELSTQGTN